MGGIVLYGGFSLAAVVLIVLARLSPVFPADQDLAQAIQAIDSSNVEQLMAAVSFPGAFPRPLVIILAIAVAFWLLRYRLEAIFVTVTLVSYPVGLLIKALVSRPRPDPALVRVLEAGATEGSFPSSHVLLATVFLGFLLYLASTRLSPGAWRWLWQGLLVAAMLAMGVSRVYLGAHWPSDVLGSYLIGGLILAPIVALYRGFIAPRWHNYEMA